MQQKKILLLPCIVFIFIALSLYLGVNNMSNNSLNQHKINEEIDGSFIFIASGHSYGSQKPRNTVPASILINNKDLLNYLKPEFFVHLGDMYQKPTLEDIQNIDSWNKDLSFPVFNAIGNHEYGSAKNNDIDIYKKYFGDTFFSFSIGNSLFLVVDSQQYRKYSIEAEQHKFVISEINKFKHSKNIKNLFIFSHHLIWAQSSEYFSKAIMLSNAPYHHSGKFNEWKSIIDSFDELTADKNVYFLSGDVGLKSSVPIFYEEDPRGRRVYIATGLGDHKEDSVLIVKIDSDSKISAMENIEKATKVSFHRLQLGNKNIKNFGLEYWSEIHPKLKK
jgi:hypothetical protein